MSAPLRFLGLAVFAWAGVRAASLSLFPGSTALVPPAAATPSPPLALRSTPADPAAAPVAQPSSYPPYGYPPYAMPSYAVPPGQPYPPPYGYGYPPPTIVVPAGYGGRPRIVYAAYPQPHRERDDWVLPPRAFAPVDGERMAMNDFAALPPLDGRPSPTAGGLERGPLPPGPPKLDRWQLSAWALMRQRPGTGTSLAGGGMLGGNQVGTRLTYKFTPRIAASLRFSSGVGGIQSAEAAAGIRTQPFRSVPVAITLERRQGLGKYGGRDAFALFAEGGLYQRRITGSWRLDAYAQGGVVGAKSRDLFADGGATVSRPVWRKVSAGLGIWGGIQPGLYRVDAGPRLTMDMGRGIKVHADYRQKLIGNALPPSGPALTIAGDF